MSSDYDDLLMEIHVVGNINDLRSSQSKPMLTITYTKPFIMLYISKRQVRNVIRKAKLRNSYGITFEHINYTVDELFRIMTH